MARKKNIVPAPSVNPSLAKIVPYPPGKPIEEVQREFGLDSVVKLASNENPLGPSPRAVKAMLAAATDMHRYPDGAGFYLKQAIADAIGVTPGEIMIGNGSDEILQLLALTYLGLKRGMVTSDYSFVRYRMAAELAGAPCVLAKMKKFSHDPAAIIAATGKNTAMICLDVPGNPTGTIMTKTQVGKVLRGVDPSTIVMLDQAYLEYAIDAQNFPDGLELRKKYPNLIVARTFSKAYGLAGLRVGYCVARPEIVADFERVRPPFNVNRMAQVAAIAALGEKAWVKRVVVTNGKERNKLSRGLEKLGLRPVESHTNFVLADCGRDGREVFQALLKLGVVVRPMPGLAGGTYIRISVGAPAENRKCLQALKELHL